MAVEGIGHWPVEASKKRKTKDERTDVDGIAQSHRCLYCSQQDDTLNSDDDDTFAFPLATRHHKHVHSFHA